MMGLIFIALLLAGCVLFLGVVCLYTDFISWLVCGKRFFDPARYYSDKMLIVVATFALVYDYPVSDRDPWDWLMVPPAGQPSFILLIFCCILAYFYSSIRTKLGSALLEIIVNGLLFTAIPLNTMTGIVESHWQTWIFCTIPLSMLLIMTLAANYRLAREGI